MSDAEDLAIALQKLKQLEAQVSNLRRQLGETAGNRLEQVEAQLSALADAPAALSEVTDHRLERTEARLSALEGDRDAQKPRKPARGRAAEWDK